MTVSEVLKNRADAGIDVAKFPGDNEAVRLNIKINSGLPYTKEVFGIVGPVCEQPLAGESESLLTKGVDGKPIWEVTDGICYSSDDRIMFDPPLYNAMVQASM